MIESIKFYVEYGNFRLSGYLAYLK